MKKFTCVIVDDEPEGADIINSFIKKTPFLETILLTHNPLEAFAYLQEHEADVLFLDIEMPQMNGLDVAKLLQHKNLHIIFTTAYSQFALEGFELNATGYLLKPITFDRFLKAMQKLFKLTGPEAIDKARPPMADEFILVKTNVRNQFRKILFKEIYYIESERNNTVFLTETGKIETPHALGELIEKLPAVFFMRVHKSFVISLSNIAKIDKSHVYIKAKSFDKEGSGKNIEKAISIGNTYSKPLEEYFKQSIMDKQGE